MNIIALITTIVLVATITVTAVLKSLAVEVEPPALAAKTAEPRQSKPASGTEKEIIEGSVSGKITESTSVPEKGVTPTLVPVPTQVTEAIVDHTKTSPEPIPEIVLNHAKTEPEIIIDCAKTDSKVIQEAPTIVEKLSPEFTDLQEAMDIANAYAQATYGVILATSLGFNNSGYRFPANAPLDCSQEFLNTKAYSIADYTFNQLIAVNHKTIDDVRSAEFLCNIYAYYFYA